MRDRESWTSLVPLILTMEPIVITLYPFLTVLPSLTVS